MINSVRTAENYMDEINIRISNRLLYLIKNNFVVNSNMPFGFKGKKK